MTNEERYKAAFSALSPAEDFHWEESRMKELKKKKTYRKVMIAAALALIVFGGTVTAYAKNVGGIQRRVQLWVRGDQTDVVVNFDTEEGSYQYTIVTEDGEAHTHGGGGVAYDIFGRERPLSEEELILHMVSPEVVTEDDGRIMLYYYDQAKDITDSFNDNGVCYVTLQQPDSGAALYMTIKKDGSYAASEMKYPDAEEF